MRYGRREDGTVINAGWINGYGNTVIIDHGGGISTLYAHNSSVEVENGQSVHRGDVDSPLRLHRLRDWQPLSF